MTTVLASLFVLGFQVTAPRTVTTDELAKHDEKTVSVVGKVSEYEEKVAKTSKKPYTVFVLKDAKGKVNVYIQGRPDEKIKDGDKVKVTGLYRKEKRVKTMTFKNEIDATNSKVKTYGVRLVK